MITHQIKKGLSSTYTKHTATNDAYSSANSHALEYLVSTPSIMNMLIDASAEMLDKLLPSDYITVGRKIELFHEHPSLVGETITLKLIVDDIREYSVFLKFEATDSKGLVCSGIYERTMINKNKLLEIAYKRSPGLI